jgi:hypothetical protein
MHPKIPSKLFNTANFAKDKTIGRSQVIQQLEHFLQEDHLPGILLHGPAGSGYVRIHSWFTFTDLHQ